MVTEASRNLQYEYKAVSFDNSASLEWIELHNNRNVSGIIEFPIGSSGGQKPHLVD